MTTLTLHRLVYVESRDCLSAPLTRNAETPGTRLDSYNTLSFYREGSLVETITGLDVIAYGTTLGDQTAAGSNRYVNFFFDGLFDRIDFKTDGYAFETDNHAFARTTNVPEPATLGLFGLGLLGAAFARRRRHA